MHIDTLYNIMELRQFIVRNRITHYADIRAEFGWADKTISKYISFIGSELYLLINTQDGRNGYIEVYKDLRPNGYLNSKQLAFLMKKYESSQGEEKQMYCELILQFCYEEQSVMINKLGMNK